MSIEVFAEVINDIKLRIRCQLWKSGMPPREARMDGYDYGKPCHYSYISCRVHDSETRKPINDKVYGIPWKDRN